MEISAVAGEAVPDGLARQLEVLLADVSLEGGREGEGEAVNRGTLPSRDVHTLDEGEVQGQVDAHLLCGAKVAVEGVAAVAGVVAIDILGAVGACARLGVVGVPMATALKVWRWCHSHRWKPCLVL